MLLRFRVENHLSLLEEQELSLIAADAEVGDVATAEVPGTDARVLPAAAIFGANASGKSNVVEALGFMQHVVTDSHRHWAPGERVHRRPFKLSAAARNMPSTFTVDFVVAEVRYEYGFSLTDERVFEEWLFSYPTRRRRMLFERDEHGIRFGSTFAGRRKLLEEIVRPNSLLLSAAASNNHPLLGQLYNWFYNDLRVATDRNYLLRLNETLDLWEAPERKRVESLLRLADFGITSVEIGENEPNDVERRIEEAFKTLERELNAMPNVNVSFEPERAPAFKLVHHGEDGPVALEPYEESNGTVTWIGIIGPILTTLNSGTVLVIDELDARLHPLLAARLVNLFQSPSSNPKCAQLIFNTHDVTMLAPHSEAQLRRDQVWLTEKSSVRTSKHTVGATKLIPLIEFRPRSGLENLERRYLTGRYGALPYFNEELMAALTWGNGGVPVEHPAEREATKA